MGDMGDMGGGKESVFLEVLRLHRFFTTYTKPNQRTGERGGERKDSKGVDAHRVDDHIRI